MESVIAIDQLCKRYRGGLFRRPVDALSGVTFQVRPGEIFGLLGPNGAGKTTVIKVLLGIARSSSGTATLLGCPAGDRRGRRQVGYLPENLRLPPHQTARSALEYYGRLSGLAKRDIVAKRGRLLETVGLTGRDRESVKRYSKGMLQRLGLAQALMHEPRLLILDEPTDGLDPVGRNQVRTILTQLRDQGHTVFLNSHLLQEVELVCDRVAILDRGQLRFEGTIAELTPRKETEIEMALCGDAAAIESVLAEWPDAKLRGAHAEQRMVAVPVGGQEDVDRLIDQFRARRVSIASLSWQRKTLEDAFLQLISQTEEAV